MNKKDKTKITALIVSLLLTTTANLPQYQAVMPDTIELEKPKQVIRKKI